MGGTGGSTHEPSRHPLASRQDIKASVGITAHLWYSLASRRIYGTHWHHGITASPYHNPLNLLIGPYHERYQPPNLSTSSTSSTYYIYIYIYILSASVPRPRPLLVYQVSFVFQLLFRSAPDLIYIYCR